MVTVILRFFWQSQDHVDKLSPVFFSLCKKKIFFSLLHKD